MKDETLLDRAFSNFKAAKMNWKAVGQDDFFINLTGYLLQQSLELYLKHYLEINGIRYPYTHDIGTLIDLLPESFEIDERLQLYAGTITSWESKTRYIKNYFLEKKNVQRGFELIEPLFVENSDLSNMQSF